MKSTRRSSPLRPLASLDYPEITMGPQPRHIHPRHLLFALLVALLLLLIAAVAARALR